MPLSVFRTRAPLSGRPVGAPLCREQSDFRPSRHGSGRGQNDCSYPAKAHPVSDEDLGSLAAIALPAQGLQVLRGRQATTGDRQDVIDLE